MDESGLSLCHRSGHPAPSSDPWWCSLGSWWCSISGPLPAGACSGRLLHEGGAPLARGYPYRTRVGCHWPGVVRTARGWGATGQGLSVLHEGGVPLARGYPHYTRPGLSWSTPECPPVGPHPRGVHPRAGESHPRFMQHTPSATRETVHDPSATRSHRTSTRTSARASATSRARRVEDVLSARGLRFITDD